MGQEELGRALEGYKESNTCVIQMVLRGKQGAYIDEKLPWNEI